MLSLAFTALACSILSFSLVSAQSATEDCSYCYSHLSSCHQPTTAPDTQIYTQCYCDSSFIAMYSACITDCGWESAGIPPLASITATCGGNAGSAEVSDSTSAAAQSTPVPTTAGATTSSSTGNAATSTTKAGTSTPTSKSTANAASPSAGSATSGLEDKDLKYGLAFRLQGALLAGLVVVWIFGWL